MHPDLVDFGFIGIKTYGAMMALGFLAAWRVAAALCRISGRRADDLQNLLVYMLIGGILGARLAYVIEHWSAEFAANPAMVIRVDRGGLMFYGGLLLDLVIFFIWCRRKGENVLKLADMVSVVLPLGHAFGRVGCFFYGCCYGKMSDAWCAVSFPRGSPAWYEQYNSGLIGANTLEALPVLPTQLFEAAAMAVLFMALLFLYRKVWKSSCGLVAGTYFIGYAAWRFANEMLRGDPRAAFLSLTIGQLISIGLALVGFSLAAYSIMCLKREGARG